MRIKKKKELIEQLNKVNAELVRETDLLNNPNYNYQRTLGYSEGLKFALNKEDE